jgi:hypothetical protein
MKKIPLADTIRLLDTSNRPHIPSQLDKLQKSLMDERPIEYDSTTQVNLSYRMFEWISRDQRKYR